MHILLYVHTCIIYDNVGWISANSFSCATKSATNSPFVGRKVQCKLECFHHRSCKFKNITSSYIVGLCTCNLRIQDKYQPVHLAAYYGHSDILKTLVNDYHVDPNATSEVTYVMLQFKLSVIRSYVHTVCMHTCTSYTYIIYVHACMTHWILRMH